MFSPTKLREGNVFNRVRLSFCSQGEVRSPCDHYLDLFKRIHFAPPWSHSPKCVCVCVRVFRANKQIRFIYLQIFHWSLAHHKTTHKAKSVLLINHITLHLIIRAKCNGSNLYYSWQINENQYQTVNDNGPEIQKILKYPRKTLLLYKYHNV